MGQNRNSVKFPDCRWPVFRSGLPNGARRFRGPEAQPIPTRPGNSFASNRICLRKLMDGIPLWHIEPGYWKAASQ